MKLIILDRDGVINYDSEHYIKTPDEWLPIPGSLKAIARLTQAGFTITIATNQSGIARGLYDAAMLEKIHQKLKTEVRQAGGKIDSIFYCPHHPVEYCYCRKPQIGLLEQIANYYHADLTGVPLVGDSWKDLEAGLSMRCKSILVKTGNGMATLKNYHDKLLHIPVFENLLDFVETFVIKQLQVIDEE